MCCGGPGREPAENFAQSGFGKADRHANIVSVLLCFGGWVGGWVEGGREGEGVGRQFGVSSRQMMRKKGRECR